MLKSFLTFARPYRTALVWTVLSMMLLVGVQLAAPLLIRQLIQTLQSGDSSPSAYRLVTQLALAALMIYLARAGLEFIRSYMAHVAGWGVVADVRRTMYNHLQKLSLRFYEDKQTGQLMSRTVNDSDLLERLIAHALPDILVNVFMLIGVSAALFWMSPTLMFLTLLPIPLIILSMWGFAVFVHPAFGRRQQDLGELNATLQDNLSGMREIMTFTRESAESERVGTRIYRYRDSNLRALKLMATFEPFVNLAAGAGVIIVIFFGGRMALAGTLPVGDLVAFFLFLELFYQPVRQLSNAWEQLQEAVAGAERVTDLLAETPDIADAPDAVALPGRARGHLRFEGVSFSYQPGQPVFDTINLDVPAGSMLALVGPTGAGKTTLASLIPRFYDVDGGCITLDGHDVRDLELRSLRSQISIVLQDVFLFHGTVKDNILFGRADATDAEVREAARVANATDFIESLPEGYDTLIGERGVKLSGGQKQRLAIARAVLRDAPILILDEATSAVDTQTERLIQEALERLMVGRTTLVIAHRLSTVRKADQIAVLGKGGIRERGTHHELLRQNGLYAQLAKTQDHPEPALAWQDASAA